MNVLKNLIGNFNMWKLIFTRQAQKDAKKLSKSGLKKKTETLLEILKTNPFSNNPPFEKLVGDLSGAYSRTSGGI